MQGGGRDPQFFAIFCKYPQFSSFFPQLLFACPPCMLVGALCVPCAEVLLLEASGGLLTAPQFPHKSPAISPQFPTIFRNWIQRSLIATPPPLVHALLSPYGQCHWDRPRCCRPNWLSRRLFSLRKSTEQLSIYMGRMDINGAKALLHGLEEMWGRPALIEQLWDLVHHIQRYRPFLPPGIFMKEDEVGEDPDLKMPLFAGHGPTVSLDFNHPNTPVSGLDVTDVTRGAVAPSLERQLMPRKGSLLYCLLLGQAEAPPAAVQSRGEEFLQAVAAAAAEYHGVVHGFSGDLVTVGWNFFGNHPMHQVCVGPLLMLSPALKRWRPLKRGVSPSRQALCSQSAHLWAAADFVPRSEALKRWGPPQMAGVM